MIEDALMLYLLSNAGTNQKKKKKRKLLVL
ncbi:hypothetical protein OCC_13580 [Thermococcus litoralis DSM 5473]|jgi:hypothetical protein|uniref:Uncharacterized protein n=1 Tax=Thermococcus litoralis (strain ATCC 51850 / DSM 5473 / JCM 8560 / NS-C) TaxID=523849 RepID=S5ZTL8_THELN|nr:hypothetical protein OCC_13580 [Thermococcus litoralis DSM 5473]